MRSIRVEAIKTPRGFPPFQAPHVDLIFLFSAFSSFDDREQYSLRLLLFCERIKTKSFTFIPYCLLLLYDWTILSATALFSCPENAHCPITRDDFRLVSLSYYDSSLSRVFNSKWQFFFLESQ
jgi:hypothetical protein